MRGTRAPQQRFAWGETRLLMDYLAATYPGVPWMTNIRVGPLDPHIPRAGLSDAAIKLMGNFRRYADAVVITEGRVVVVETTIQKAVQKVGQLLEYLDLVPLTPELAEHSGKPLSGVLVSAIPDPRAQALCGKVGLHFVVFEPSWLAQFLAVYRGGFRRAPLSGGGQTFFD